jgi:predicted ThiF/HesA family dinucleotide-utilizing enzyme
LNFEDVSNQFEKLFNNKIAILKSYIQKKNLDVIIDIVVEIVDGEKPSIHFNKQIIKICKELGSEIDIDMYILN